MDIIIRPSKVLGTVNAPPSKSFSHRALICAALSDGNSSVQNILLSDDILMTLNALKHLSVPVTVSDNTVSITGQKGKFHPEMDSVFLDCQNSGTTLRFFTACATRAKSKVILDGSSRLRKRPMGELIYALRHLGAKLKASKNNSSAPIYVEYSQLSGGTINISGNQSSQFVSALLLIAPYCTKSLRIIVKNLRSAPYVDITIEVMKHFGVEIQKDHHLYKVQQQQYRGINYKVEGDFSSAAYFFAAAAITSSSVTVKGLNLNTVQGDSYILTVLEKMGCSIKKGDNWASVMGRTLQAIDTDLGNYPDIVPIIAVVASYARGTTYIRNIGNLRLKESDRIKAISSELTKMGVVCNEYNDSLAVKGSVLHGAILDPHNDHRIAMSCAIAALGASGKTVIKNADVVTKSYPLFYNDLKKLNAIIEI